MRMLRESSARIPTMPRTGSSTSTTSVGEAIAKTSSPNAPARSTALTAVRADLADYMPEKEDVASEQEGPIPA